MPTNLSLRLAMSCAVNCPCVLAPQFPLAASADQLTVRTQDDTLTIPDGAVSVNESQSANSHILQTEDVPVSQHQFPGFISCPGGQLIVRIQGDKLTFPDGAVSVNEYKPALCQVLLGEDVPLP